ncbi:complement C1q-like protein 3 [Ostrea edulis]|uniref:complement C1q-like protein 3 n=1 Tax=Ostrea edulis TaxID=37623 RepID=UPI002095830B|nr:complement C1q-like protein 3 [Ostrea edulis]
MIPREIYFVFCCLVSIFLNGGQCEMTVDEVYRTTLELTEIVNNLAKTVVVQNNRIAYLQRAFNKQRMNCLKTALYNQEKTINDADVASGDLFPTSPKENSTDLSSIYNNSSERAHPSAKSLPPASFRPSVIRKGRLLIPPSTQHPTTAPRTTAFYAYLSSDVSHTGQGQILRYDVVKANAGNGYYRSSGVFIAPESGYYVFSWTSRIKHYGGNGEDHALELVVDGVVYGSIYMKSLSGEDGQATGVAIAHVNRGDNIYIQTHSQDPGSGAIRSDFYGRSSFAGWKIY